MKMHFAKIIKKSGIMHFRLKNQKNTKIPDNLLVRK